MKRYGVRVYVDDYGKARAFYVETLGLKVKWERAEKGALGLELDGDELIVQATRPTDQRRDFVGRLVEASIAVADIEVAYAELSGKGVAFTKPPVRPAWGCRVAYFSDPAGNILTLIAGCREG